MISSPSQKKYIGCIAGIVVILVFFVGWSVWQYRQKWAPIPMPENTATVGATMTPARLGELLQQKHKVLDARTFEEAANRIQLLQVQPGVYKLPKTAGPMELAQIFARVPELVKVTFPEGWTAHQMATRLAREHLSAADDFRELAYPANKSVSPWEGRLFPDTYLFSRRAKAREIIQVMHEHFEKVGASLPRPFPQLSEGKVLSMEQVTTLASLVERETAVPSERALVAGVLLNRLRKKMRLQCDATVQYARELAAARDLLNKGHKNRLLHSDLKIDSPYNTYRHGGLPPGPICNPGAASLRAAARPKASDYLFYVWAPKLKRHLFAKTYVEHLYNVRLARKN